MSTKKFKVGTSDGNSVKAGRNNTRTVLTGLGVVTLGGAAAGLGYAAGLHDGAKEPDNPQEEAPVENLETPQVGTQEEQVMPGDAGQQTAQDVTSLPSNVDAINEPQPVDTTTNTDTGTTQVESTTTTEKETIEEGKLDEEAINDIANQIIDQQNIDPDDIDSPTIISVDDLAVVHRADGSEALVAVIHTPDGGEYLLADYDGDGYFTDVFDTMGNYIGEAEGNLMVSDLHHMVEAEGYLASNDEPQGDDPTQDIVNTENPASASVGNDVAVNTTTPTAHDEDEVTDEELLNGDLDEEISEEELLAQFLEDEDENEEEEFFDDDEEDDGYGHDVDVNDELGEG